MLCLAAGAGCARQAPSAPGPAAVEVEMKEFALAAPGTVEVGRAVVRARNEGAAPHELYLIELRPDDPPLAEIVRPGRPTGTVPLAHLGPVPAGGTGAFAFDFPAGRFGLLCLLKDSAGRFHASRGLHATIEVKPGPAPELPGRVVAAGGGGPFSISARTPQGGDGTSVVLEEAVMGAPGYVAVHADVGGGRGPGPVIGVLELPAGTHRAVTVPLLRPLALDAFVFPMIHVEDGASDAYDFPEGDAPALEGGVEVMVRVDVRL